MGQEIEPHPPTNCAKGCAPLIQGKASFNMRKKFLCGAIAALALTSSAYAAGTTPKTEDEKTIYALGLNVGRSLKVFNLSKAEIALLEKGISDQITGAK